MTHALPIVAETLDAVGQLQEGRFSEVEVFHKRGRSRRLELSTGGRRSLTTHEAGWAVRAGDRRGSFFAAGTGAPKPGGPWPEADGAPIRLPEPTSAPPWSAPPDLDAPLIGDREGLNLLDSIAAALARELPGARLLQGAVEDGSSETWIASSRGIDAAFRSRLASLYLEGAGPGRLGPTAAFYLAEREARRFNPLALARRLADRLQMAHEGEPRQRDRGEMLLAPPVMCRILAGLLPLWSGPQATARAEALQDRRGHLGSEHLTLLDNGRLSGGALEAPFDGEGVPTREVVLVDHGVFRHPLLPWWQCPDEPWATGCSRRPGWRDLPTPMPTHLYLRPRSGVSVAALLQDITRGYYLIDVTASGHFDLEADRFSLPVCGFEMRNGRATAPIARTQLCGSISALLRGVQAVARDLSFQPLRGMIGSPTVLVSGLELRGESS